MTFSKILRHKDWSLIKKGSLQQSQKSLSSSLAPSSVVKSELDVAIMSTVTLGN